ncbi:malectin domain-containing carbohydrate-binding protein [Winogradskyella sp. A2]|uniref:Kelch repeat-containing protein n=1 Tax=Winogradskyella sp. A2 TaxID=3366944 RepID=UPI00398C6BE3
MCLKFKLTFISFIFLLNYGIVNSQSISFGSSGLNGTNITNPTSIDFGPNGKLYVSQQNGIIWEYDVERDDATPGNGTYTITNTNQITLIKNNTPNHNDDGTNNSTQARQITGILATGSASNPILYVTSSDSRIGGGGSAGNDVNLDTNSGVLSRLKWNGSAWEKVDLVRGLPRCEENHSTNGLDMFTSGVNTYLLIQQGGNTNQGAPSNNFAGSSEYYLSGALLIVDLTQLEQMESNNGGPYQDPRIGNTAYIYDLPSLNDPDRQDINNTHPSFPYSSSHPLYNATIDLGDPFGGNNGLNQTFPEDGGPVQIFSPGYRNAYDVVVTENGRVFTSDNGPNGGWGGAPLIYDSNDNLKGTQNSTTYNSGAGDYVTNEFNIENGSSLGDAFHFVGTTNDANNTYYGGHPVPIRAFPDKAGIYKYEYNGSNWVENGSYDWSNLIVGVTGYFNPSGFTMSNFPNDPRQGNYNRSLSSPDVNILDIVNSSTNGICEYTATNFGGAMQGDILSASFNGNINRYEFDTDGITLLSQDNGFLNGFGSIPLDLIALGDSHPYAGTIWVVTYGADDVTVFEPADFVDCPQPGDGDYVGSNDYDNDGYTNDDEISNGTNHCSAGSKPNDYDGDLISDLTDPDDDNDGILDVNDVFAIDAQNGLNTNLPINYPFWNNDPGTGFFGLGFTGLQLDPSGNTAYINQFNSDNLSFGGAGGKATIDEVSSGNSLNGTNTQENAFQFGVNLDTNSNPFTIYSKIETPFNGSAPLATQSYGIFIGNGDQDNYLKIAIMDGTTNGDSAYGFEVTLEDNGVSSTSTYDVSNLLQAIAVNLYISVNPSTNLAQVFYSLNDGITIASLGTSITLPASFLDPNDSNGMAVGIISTSGSSGSVFTATWDFINITEDIGKILDPSTTLLDFGESDPGGSINELNLGLKNLGNPIDGAIEITQVNFNGTNANLFSSNLSLPIEIGPQTEALLPIAFTPDNNIGTKSASLEITHNGSNSPLIVSLTSEIFVETPVVRINAGSPTTINSTDNGPDWESNPSQGSYSGVSYSVNTGNISNTNFLYSNRDSSIPDYIDEATFDEIFSQERWDEISGEEMAFSIPISNGNYKINLYLGNNCTCTNQIGERIFDILIEGTLVKDNLDLVSSFGHQVASMLSYSVSVDDNELNILFDHELENPLINAIEVVSLSNNVNLAPIAVASANPTSGEAPLNVMFSANDSTDDNDNIVNYNWDFGNGDTATGVNSSYAFTQNGTYTVTLTVTDGVGNIDKNTIDINVGPLDPCQWNSLEDSDLAKIEGPSAKIGDKLYVFAGFLAGLQITGATEIYDTISNTWSYGAPMPDPVTHMGVAVVGSDIWIVSGFLGNHPGVATDKVQIYDTINDSWSVGPPLPVPRGSGAIAYNNGKIHYFGGLLPDRITDVDDHYVLDINDQGAGWVSAAPLPNARNHLSAASFNGLIYAIGGQTNHDNESEIEDKTLLEVYNPDNNSWSTLEDLPSPRSHFEPGTFVHNGKIIIVGGRNGPYFFYDDITEYDIANDTWAELCELPENLLAPAARVFGDQLIVANGGINGINGPIKTTQWIPIQEEFPTLEMDPISDQFNQVSESVSLTLSASGGDPDGNITYAIEGQPTGISIEPTNGLIIGTVDALALIGGPNNDGIHLVTVTISKPGSEDVFQNFIWTITSPTLSGDNSIINRLNIFNDYLNQSIKISGLITKPSIVKLYDLQGRLVISRTLQLNTRIQDIKVSGLEKGIYVINIISSTEKMTKKLILR